MLVHFSVPSVISCSKSFFCGFRTTIHRMLRWTGRIFVLLSLLICVLVGVAWVRSYFVGEMLILVGAVQVVLWGALLVQVYSHRRQDRARRGFAVVPKDGSESSP